MRPHEDELTELLHFLGAGCITPQEVRGRLKQIRPEWFEEVN